MRSPRQSVPIVAEKPVGGLPLDWCTVRTAAVADPAVLVCSGGWCFEAAFGGALHDVAESAGE